VKVVQYSRPAMRRSAGVLKLLKPANSVTDSGHEPRNAYARTSRSTRWVSNDSGATRDERDTHNPNGRRSTRREREIACLKDAADRRKNITPREKKV